MLQITFLKNDTFSKNRIFAVFRSLKIVQEKHKHKLQQENLVSCSRCELRAPKTVSWPPHRTPTGLSHALTTACKSRFINTCTHRITVMFTSSLWDVHVLVWPVDKGVPIRLPVGDRLFYTSCSGYTETMRELKQTNFCSHLSMTW